MVFTKSLYFYSWNQFLFCFMILYTSYFYKPPTTMPVHMKDALAVEKKIAALIAGGSKQLKVISDFDYTLTRYWGPDGDQACSCYKVIEDCEFLPASYHIEAKKLQVHYHAVEIDPHVSHDEKVESMKEWMHMANDLLAEAGLRRDDIPKLVNDGKIYFRDATDSLMELIVREAIPILIFSGGITDIMLAVIKRYNISVGECTHFVSNKMNFSEDGMFTGLQEPVFHVFNKFAGAIANEPFMKAEQHRKNIILLGDSLGDINMTKGMDTNTLLTIGYLNANFDDSAQLEKYKNIYDVVLVNDNTVNYQLDLFKRIERHHNMAISIRTSSTVVLACLLCATTAVVTIVFVDTMMSNVDEMTSASSVMADEFAELFLSERIHTVKEQIGGHILHPVKYVLSLGKNTYDTYELDKSSVYDALRVSRTVLSLADQLHYTRFIQEIQFISFSGDLLSTDNIDIKMSIGSDEGDPWTVSQYNFETNMSSFYFDRYPLPLQADFIRRQYHEYQTLLYLHLNDHDEYTNSWSRPRISPEGSLRISHAIPLEHDEEPFQSPWLVTDFSISFLRTLLQQIAFVVGEPFSTLGYDDPDYMPHFSDNILCLVEQDTGLLVECSHGFGITLLGNGSRKRIVASESDHPVVGPIFQHLGNLSEVEEETLFTITSTGTSRFPITSQEYFVKITSLRHDHDHGDHGGEIATNSTDHNDTGHAEEEEHHDEGHHEEEEHHDEGGEITTTDHNDTGHAEEEEHHDEDHHEEEEHHEEERHDEDHHEEEKHHEEEHHDEDHHEEEEHHDEDHHEEEKHHEDHHEEEHHEEEDEKINSSPPWLAVAIIPRAKLLAAFDKRTQDVRKNEEKGTITALIVAGVIIIGGVAVVFAYETALINPLLQIMRDMHEIEQMNMNHLGQEHRRRITLFQEINKIRLSFIEMTEILVEYKAFVPSYLLQGDEREPSSDNDNVDSDTRRSSVSKKSQVSACGVSPLKTLFALDLHNQYCSFLTITTNFDDNLTSSSYNEILSFLVATTIKLHPHVMVSAGFIQVVFNAPIRIIGFSDKGFHCANLLKRESFSFVTGISYEVGEAEVGNVGCQSQKWYVVRADELIELKVLSQYASYKKTPFIVCNEKVTTVRCSGSSYIFAAVDILRVTQNVVVLFRIMCQQEEIEEEWMYAVQSEEQSIYYKYNKGVFYFMSGQFEAAKNLLLECHGIDRSLTVLQNLVASVDSEEPYRGTSYPFSVSSATSPLPNRDELENSSKDNCCD